MSKVSKGREMTGALVPVSTPLDGDRSASDRLASARLASAPYGDHATGGTGLPFARSAFLTQLSCQYETKRQGRTRRAEARALASKKYGKSRQDRVLRHLVWA